MLNVYGNPELFKDILWFDGIKRILIKIRIFL